MCNLPEITESADKLEELVRKELWRPDPAPLPHAASAEDRRGQEPKQSGPPSRGSIATQLPAGSNSTKTEASKGPMRSES